MNLYDQHLHSHHSFDCRTEPVTNVEQAIEKGLAGLTFTEHFDTHPEDWIECVYDDRAYSATITGLRERFGDRIFIGKGIEICYQPDRMDFVLDFLSRHRFDLVIFSVHYFGEKAVHRKENWEGIDRQAGTRKYLEHVRDAVRFCARLHASKGRIFDALGHLDLVKRYTQRYFGAYDVAAFDDVLDDILSTCLEADLVPEINTSSLRQNLPETMPGVETVRRYAHLGGVGMSVGSDAHRSTDVGAGLEVAVSHLNNAGIPKIAVFRGREREWVSVVAKEASMALRPDGRLGSSTDA